MSDIDPFDVLAALGVHASDSGLATRLSGHGRFITGYSSLQGLGRKIGQPEIWLQRRHLQPIELRADQLRQQAVLTARLRD